MMSMGERETTGSIHWHGVLGGSRITGNIPIGQYPSGEPVLSFFTKDAYVERLLLRPMSMHDLMGGLFFVDALVERGQGVPELILPFVPGARQDRLNDIGDFLFTAKSVAKEINARGFKKVTILDPHSEVIAALIDRCATVHAHECLGEPIGYSAVISPDAGAEKRAGAVATKLGVPLLHGWKTRDVATGKISGFGLEPTDRLTYEGRSIEPCVLVVDDICDGGGTFIGLAPVLKERGLVADLYVTHGIFSQGTEKLFEHYAHVMCTDSIFVPRANVNVINVCDKLLRGS